MGFRTKVIGIFSNPCVFNARQQAKAKKKKGYRVRFGHGIVRFKGMKKTRWYVPRLGGCSHMWAEYYDTKQEKWLMCKDTIKNVNGGYPVESYPEYQVHWYGE